MVKNIISVKNLSKSFDISNKEPGLKGTIKHFFRRQTKSIKVIKNISFEIKEGEIVEAIKVSSVAKISDFRITDGKGIGVILQLSNGKEQWFFEDEIDLLDENGNVIEKYIDIKENSNFIFNFLRGLNYENKNKISELLNPINFFIWLIVSLKDIF